MDREKDILDKICISFIVCILEFMIVVLSNIGKVQSKSTQTESLDLKNSKEDVCTA